MYTQKMLRFNFRRPIKSYTRSLPNNIIQKIVIPSWYYKVELGEYSYMNDRAFVHSCRNPQTISIGKYCSIGECTFTCDCDHNHAFATTYPFREFKLSQRSPDNSNVKDPPIIMNDVWICDGSFVHGNVLIGNGSVIAANSIVTKNVPPYAIVGGNPARILKYRFDETTIQRLELSAWWNLPYEFVCSDLAVVMDNVEEFLRRAERYRSDKQKNID